MTREELKEVLRLHKLWLKGNSKGKRANLSQANLSQADLSQADLSWADLSEANLSQADLSWADLSWANLSQADLSWANLSRANLSRARGIVLGPPTTDGYNSWLTHNGQEYRVRMRCRDFSFSGARAHWKATRGGTALGEERLAIVDYLESRKEAMILA